MKRSPIDLPPILSVDLIQITDTTAIPFAAKAAKTLEEIKEYYNQNLKDKIGGRGPNKKKSNSEGFYEAKINGVTKVFLAH